MSAPAGGTLAIWESSGDPLGGIGLKAREFAYFRALIYREAGIHLREVKQTMLAARLTRRVRHLGLDSFADYIHHLESDDDDGEELRELINCVTTNKTDFFRERHHFEFLGDRLFPAIRARAAQGGPRRLRIWSAGCSTGEEPYSLAMTIREHFGPLPGWDVKIIASDIDTQVLATAERGLYADERMRSVPDLCKRRYFQRRPAGSTAPWCVRPELRELIEFRQVNLIDERWPIAGPFDAIFCRNVVIYFDRPTQERLFERMAALLDPEGHLFIGHSESLIGVSDRFALIEKTVHRLRSAGTPARRQAVVPAAPALVPPAPAPRPPPPVRQVVVGEVLASREPTVVRTLLGSCVSACLYDPVARIGGMNHFLVPEGEPDGSRATRYGVHAMELLINEMMKLGADRGRLVAKVFGAAEVLRNTSNTVPRENARFVRDFLRTEGIPIAGERLGGTRAVEVWFHTALGRARIRYVSAAPSLVTGEREAQARVTAQLDADGSRVTLF
jgi:chemotaxis protein methyltransferase CheR